MGSFGGDCLNSALFIKKVRSQERHKTVVVLGDRIWGIRHQWWQNYSSVVGKSTYLVYSPSYLILGSLKLSNWIWSSFFLLIFLIRKNHNKFHTINISIFIQKSSLRSIKIPFKIYIHLVSQILPLTPSTYPGNKR